MPRALVVQKGEKIFSFRSGEIPLAVVLHRHDHAAGVLAFADWFGGQSDPRFALAGGGFGGIGDEMGEGLGQGGLRRPTLAEGRLAKSCRSATPFFVDTRRARSRSPS